MIVFYCPGCGQKYELGDEYAGMRGQCEVCGKEFEIPQKTAAVKLQVPPQVVKEKKNSNALMILLVFFFAVVGVTAFGGQDAGMFLSLILVGVIVLYGIIKAFTKSK